MLECKLEDIADVVDCEHKTAPTVSNSDYYSIRTTDILGGKIDFQKANRVSHETYVDWTKRALPESGNLILAREAPVGEIGWIKKGYKVCLGQRTVLIKVKSSQVDSRFLLYYFVNPATKIQLQEQSGGSVVSHLNMKDIRNFDLQIPSIEVQKAIASVLSSLDDKIDLLHRQNTTLERMAETLFRQWFVEEAQEDWELHKLGNCVTISYGKNLPTKNLLEDGFPVFGANGQIGFYDRYTYDEPQVLVSCRGEASGKVNISLPKSYVTNNSLVLERNKMSEISFEFLKYWALSYDFDLHVSGSAQPQITIDGLYDADFTVPPKGLIENFTEMVKGLETKKLNNFFQIQTLEKLRDNLLPKLMSGEVRVI